MYAGSCLIKTAAATAGINSSPKPDQRYFDERYGTHTRFHRFFPNLQYLEPFRTLIVEGEYLQEYMDIHSLTSDEQELFPMNTGR